MFWELVSQLQLSQATNAFYRLLRDALDKIGGDWVTLIMMSDVVRTTTEITFCCSSKIWEAISKVLSFSKELVQFFQIKISAKGHFLFYIKIA
jgi:hypothetical protein